MDVFRGYPPENIKQWILVKKGGTTTVTYTPASGLSPWSGVVTSVSYIPNRQYAMEVNLGSSLSSIDYSGFSDCHYLNKIDIPTSVKSIGDNAFYNCYQLTSMTIPDSVTDIGMFAFSGCGGMQTMYFGSGMNDYSVIGHYAFYNTSNLSEVWLTWMSSYKVITDAKDWALGMTRPVVVHCSDGDVLIGYDPEYYYDQEIEDVIDGYY